MSSSLKHILIPVISLFAYLVFSGSAKADSFVMPTDGYLFLQQVGGNAAATTTFGLGTSQNDFLPIYTGLPNKPSPTGSVLVGFFVQGTVIDFAMFTTFSGASGWAFSSGTDTASLFAFSDIDNSLGLGGSIIQQTGTNRWVLHLDDALSFGFDDDDNDVLMGLRVSKHLSSVPEPTTSLLFLSGVGVVAWKARRRRRALHEPGL